MQPIVITMVFMSDEDRAIAINRRANFEYHIDETYEAGMVLVGTEVKSLRDGKANLSDAFGRVRGNAVYLLNLHITPYGKAARDNHEPTRTRKLLLHKGEIERLRGKTLEKGYALIPLRMYWKNGVAKILLGLGKGKKLHDKRADSKEKDAKRDMSRALRDSNR
jgi:SsrA-binding protein